MKTPHIAHLTEEDYEHVYEPAEDSFILLDALEEEVDTLRRLEPTICVEIGCGSGVVSTFLGQLLHPLESNLFATDINEFACSASRRTSVINNVVLSITRCNLLDPYYQRMAGKVDILVFNPPYVPTSTAELELTQDEKTLGGAWAGGQIGMDVTDLVIEQLDHFLGPMGRFYLVAVEQNHPQAILKNLRDKHFQAEIVLRRRAGRELLYVIRATRQ